MDRISPSEGGDARSIRAEGTKISEFSDIFIGTNRTGKGENGSFHSRRKVHENPKVFV